MKSTSAALGNVLGFVFAAERCRGSLLDPSLCRALFGFIVKLDNFVAARDVCVWTTEVSTVELYCGDLNT